MYGARAGRRSEGVDVDLRVGNAGGSRGVGGVGGGLTARALIEGSHLVQELASVVVHEGLLSVGQLVGREEALAHLRR